MPFLYAPVAYYKISHLYDFVHYVNVDLTVKLIHHKLCHQLSVTSAAVSVAKIDRWRQVS